MENINIGLVNLIISNKLKDSYLDNNNDLIEESKKNVIDFFEIIKNSPILQLEFKVFNNIENKYIPNELAASRYIDNNIKLFDVYTINEIKEERNKLNNLIVNESLNVDDNNKLNLYKSIDNLIVESINSYDNIDVDKIHESFTYVLNYILDNKIINNNLNETVDYNDIDEDVIEIAIDKFNEKYNGLNEDDKNLLQTLIKSKISEKKKILEDYKTENITYLENLNKNEIKDNIVKAIKKINEMKYNPDTIDEDIISLYELKNNLL